jgi:hypothetical protein
MVTAEQRPGRGKTQLRGRNGVSPVDVRSGSKGEMLVASRCFPLFTQQRTSLNRVGMSTNGMVRRAPASPTSDACAGHNNIGHWAHCDARTCYMLGKTAFRNPHRRGHHLLFQFGRLNIASGPPVAQAMRRVGYCSLQPPSTVRASLHAVRGRCGNSERQQRLCRSA